MELPADERPAATLLYVEDDEQTQELVIHILRSKFPRITLLLAQNGRDGFDLYTRHRPDIVVTDVRMPIVDGIRMSKQIKALGDDTQIIVLSAASDADHLMDAIDVGISHYVLKPIKMERFISAVERCLDTIGLKDQLRQKEECINRMAYHDSLTGLPNRHLFTEFLNKALAHAQRHDRFLSVLYLDLDGFKAINDTLGHAGGDQLLKEVAQRLKTCCSRDQDTVARWGGDEFTILLPDIDGPQEAVSVARKLIEAFARPVMLGDRPLSVGMSIGVSLFPGGGADGDALIRSADLAMYCAKRKGRNQFHLASGNDR